MPLADERESPLRLVRPRDQRPGKRKNPSVIPPFSPHTIPFATSRKTQFCFFFMPPLRSLAAHGPWFFRCGAGRFSFFVSSTFLFWSARAGFCVADPPFFPMKKRKTSQQDVSGDGRAQRARAFATVRESRAPRAPFFTTLSPFFSPAPPARGDLVSPPAAWPLPPSTLSSARELARPPSNGVGPPARGAVDRRRHDRRQRGQVCVRWWWGGRRGALLARLHWGVRGRGLATGGACREGRPRLFAARFFWPPAPRPPRWVPHVRGLGWPNCGPHLHLGGSGEGGDGAASRRGGAKMGHRGKTPSTLRRFSFAHPHPHTHSIKTSATSRPGSRGFARSKATNSFAR